MKKWLIPAALLLFVLLVMLIFVARPNSRVGNTGRYDYLEGFVSGSIIKIVPFKVELAFVNKITTAKQAQQLRDGSFRIVGMSNGVKPDKNLFTFYVSGPRDFTGLGFKGQQARAKTIIENALKAKADAFVYTSNEDGFFSSEEGRQQAELLKKAKIIRAVIFDGGHHLSSLRSDPDMLLCPIMLDSNGNRVIAHGFIRDAVPFNKFKGIIKSSTLGCSIVTFTRFMPVKNTTALGLITRKALLSVYDKSRSRGHKNYNFFYFKPGAKEVLPKEGINVIGLDFGVNHFPSLQIPPYKQFKKTKADLEKNKNNNVLSLPYSVWDIIKNKI